MALNLFRTRVKIRISAPKTTECPVRYHGDGTFGGVNVLAALRINAATKVAVEAEVASSRRSIESALDIAQPC